MRRLYIPRPRGVKPAVFGRVLAPNCEAAHEARLPEIVAVLASVL